MSATNDSHADLTFVFSTDDAAYRKVFCVSPIDVYITTMSYGFILCYIPSLKRPMLYAHLSVLYSLLIAGTVSIAKHELTKADSIFVLVCVSSPASIYLWALMIRSFWYADAFPIEHRNKQKTASQSLEVQITRIITLGSLAYTIAYLLITFVPSEVIKFAQPACDKEYGINLWFNLAWMLPVALQMAAIAFAYFFAWAFIRVSTRHPFYTAPPQVFDAARLDSSGHTIDDPAANIGNIDIITWTETVLNDQFPSMSRTSITCISTMLQLASLPTFVAPAFVSKDLGTLVALIYVVWSRSPQHLYESDSANLVMAKRIGMSVALGGYFVLRFMGVPLFPAFSDALFFFIGCTTAAWCLRTYKGSSICIRLSAFLVAYGLFVALLVGSSTMQVPIDTIKFSINRPTPGNLAKSDFSPASLDVLSLGMWAVSWLSTSAWPFNRKLTWNQLRILVFKRAHILKCCCLILAPHILWIQSTSLASPTRTNEMPFGQIFALIVAIMTLFTLLDEAKDVSSGVWWAFVKSDCMPPGNNEERSIDLGGLPQTRDTGATPAANDPTAPTNTP